MSSQSIIASMVILLFIFVFSSIAFAHELTNATAASSTKRVDEETSLEHVKQSKDMKTEPMMKASSNSHRKSLSPPRKSPSITIPIKNAVVQALTPVSVDRHEAEAAHLNPSRYSSESDGSFGEIIYEDELQGEMGEWIPPPPPPPPEYLYRKPSSYNAPAAVPASTFQRLTGITRYPHSSSARLFGDDFALFLVILTIAGFFGLMLAMFMPFTFLLQQQPLTAVSPYPSGAYGSAYGGNYGYPYGRRRRRRHLLNEPVAWSRATEIGFAELLINSFFKALSQYEKLNSDLDRKRSSEKPSLLRRIFSRLLLSNNSSRKEAVS